jgi:hypothetical protein
MSVRLFRGPISQGRTLLFAPELLVVSLCIIIGSVGLLASDLRALVFMAVGVVGVGRWWRLYRSTGGSSQQPAA